MASENHITLLDGGMGQELIRRSSKPISALWSAQILMDEPELVQQLHCDFIKAGARIITLNSYIATPQRLARDAAESWFEPLQRKAIEVAHAARCECDTSVQIAGCLPPLLASYQPKIALPFEDSLKSYRKIVNLQKDHVSMFLCETMSSEQDALAALQAGLESGLPVWVGLTVDDAAGKKLRSGEPLAQVIAKLKANGAAAILLNCSSPEAITQGISELKSTHLPHGAYANGFTSVTDLKIGGTVDTLSARTDLAPETYAKHALNWVDHGATLIGGCCEVGPAHIQELALQLGARGLNISGAHHG